MRISKDRPALEYQGWVCAKRFLGVCVERKMLKEHEDLTDPAVREKLAAMDIVCRVREKP